MRTTTKAILAAALLPAVLAQAQPCTLEIQSRLSGAAQEVKLAGDTAFVAAGPGGLLIVDASDPDRLRMLGQFRPDEFSGFASHVEAAGAVVYLALDSDQILIIDAADPAHPALLSAIELDDKASSLRVENSTLYVAVDDLDDTVVWFDVSDPASPIALGDLNGRLSQSGVRARIQDLEVENSVIYLLMREGAFPEPAGRLLAFDAAEPTAPIFDIQLETRSSDLVVRDELIYLAGHLVRVLDASDPKNVVPAFTPTGEPVETSSLGPFDDNFTLFAKTTGGQLIEIGVANPENPILAATYASDLVGEASDFDVHGELLLALNEGAVHTVDIAAPGIAAPLDAIAAPFFSNEVPGNGDVRTAGDHVYVAASGRLITVDIKDPAEPSIVEVLESATGNALDLRGDLLAMLDGPAGLIHLVDVSTPNAPALISSTSFDGVLSSLTDVALAEGALIVTQRADGVDVYNISNPAALGPAAELNLGKTTNAVATQGDTAYYATDGAVLIYDISNPALQVPLGEFTVAGDCYDLEIHGDRLYLACAPNNFLILDVSDPAAPALLGQRTITGELRKLTVSDDLAYVYSSSAGLVILTVVDPANPGFVGARPELTRIGDIALSGDTPWIIDSGAGLVALSTCITLSGDAVTDSADLGILLAAWGSTDSPADLDGDGVVGPSDLGILLAAWNG